MDMIKVTKEMIPEVEIVDVCGKNNTVVKVKKHIPYAEKETMAMELSMYCNVEDTEHDVMYDNYNEELIQTMMICKYYTNIDMSGLSDQESWKALFDWLVFNELLEGIRGAIEMDVCYVNRMLNALILSIRSAYAQEHNLSYRVQKTFGSVLNGQDFAETIAKAADVNNEIISMMEAKKKIDSQTVGGKNKISVGNGPVINIAKKKGK